MKNRSTTLWITLLTLVLSACGGGSEEQSVEINSPEEVKAAEKQAADMADVSFIDGMTGKVFHNYLQVKMSLVNSDADGAKIAAANMAEAFGEEQAELRQLAKQMAETGELETQRELFSQFTTKVEPLFKGAVSEGEIYKQYCPMAFNNQGAYWFADVKEIRNPYFGDRMLKCGRVEETITKN